MTCTQLSREDGNETIIEGEIRDEDYMSLDDLQKVTSDFVTEYNSSLVPTLLWRPFVEAILINITDQVDLDKEKILIADLEYLQKVALILSATEDEILGEPCSTLIETFEKKHQHQCFRNFYLVDRHRHDRAIFFGKSQSHLGVLHQQIDERGSEKFQIDPMRSGCQPINGYAKH